MATSTAPSRASHVAVVTVSYGSESVLEAFLESLPSATAKPISVTVADNRAEQGERVAAIAKKAHAKYLPIDGNKGYGVAMNTAVEAIEDDTEWILISNADVIVGAGAIDTLISTGSSDKQIGAVGPAILTETGSVYPSARSVPSLRTGIGHAILGNRWVNNPWTRAYRRESSNAPVRRDAGWLSGACLLIRRSAFSELGGFDPGFFMYFEYVNLGYRLDKAGYRIVYEPGATVTPTGGHSTSTDSARMIAIRHDSPRRFLNKKYSGAVLWPVRAVFANINDKIKNGPVRHCHVLGLAGWEIRKMDATHCATARNRGVRLAEV